MKDGDCINTIKIHDCTHEDTFGDRRTVLLTFKDEETAKKFIELWRGNWCGTQMMKLRGNQK